MKFMRRPDIDTVTRIHIATQAFLNLGVYGEITRLATCYRVSRLFVYTLLWKLMLLYELEMGRPESPEVMRKEVDRHILLLRFEGHCALERMSQILTQLDCRLLRSGIFRNGSRRMRGPCPQRGGQAHR